MNKFVGFRVSIDGERYDLMVVGAGIFGIYASIHYSRLGMRVLLVERERKIWKKASVVNQARVHTGYHYPRSMKTARMANDNRERFLKDHDYAINDSFMKYYGVDSRGSLTGSKQFVRFGEKLSIPLTRTSREDIFKQSSLEDLFMAEEYSFDPLLIKERYRFRLKSSAVDYLPSCDIIGVENDSDRWMILAQCMGEEVKFYASAVLNATYSNINHLNDVFGVERIPATHELSELVIASVPALKGVGLTVMDGPYISVMPFGHSGFHSLSSVLYTHKAFSDDDLPTFECQNHRSDCTPHRTRACNSCKFKPPTNSKKIIRHVQNYLSDNVEIFPQGTLSTVKTKLKSTHIDDGRPTDIRIFTKRPFYGCIFSGKINSIYEVEGITFNA